MKNNNLISPAFIRFVIVGVLNTGVYYIVYLLLLSCHISYMISHLCGFLSAFIFSYFLNCYFVYRVKPSIKTFLQFPLTQVVNMGLQTLLLYFFVDLFHWNKELAPFPALIITVPVTYLLSKKILTRN